MDQFNARLISAISEILLEVELDDAGEQTELHEIGRRLKSMSARLADDLSCERIRRELQLHRSLEPVKKRLS
ncbi:MAG: hypothetical protein Tsb0032_25140 [Kiloniellaceae bacterium]